MSDIQSTLLLFVIVYATYHITSFPSVTGGDSGELLAEACLLGTAHPPGYPLFTMLTHLVAMVPFPRITVTQWDTTNAVAWRINNLCALLGATTAALIWLSARSLARVCNFPGFNGSNNFGIVSTIGAMSFAFAPLVWEYSVTAEVFALNNCLCAAIIFVTCKTVQQVQIAATRTHGAGASVANQRKLLRLCLLGGLLCGLALSNQHASALLVACVAPTILGLTWTYTPKLVPPVLVRCAGGVLLGMSTYLYLPWAARQPTTGSWGELATIAGIVKHVLRAEYGTFRLGMIVGSETWWQRIGHYLRHTSEEGNHLVFPVLLLAVVVWAWSRKHTLHKLPGRATVSSPAPKKVPKGSNKSTAGTVAHSKEAETFTATTADGHHDSQLGTLLLAAVVGKWVFYTLVWHCILSNLPLSAPMPFAVHSRFWMQPNILLYVLMCVAIEYLCGWCATSASPLRSVVGGAGLALAVLYLAVVLYVRFPSMDKSAAGDVMLRYGEAVLGAAMQSPVTSIRQVQPKLHSLLLSHTDLDWNPVRYLQHCEGVGMPPEAHFRKSPLRFWAPSRRSGDHGDALVTQLNFQIMPYPWFRTTQAALYPHVRFPNMDFPGVTTDRKAEGNAQLILRFLYANALHNQTYTVLNAPSTSTENDHSNADHLPVVASTHSVFTGGVYLDMQAVQEAEIEDLGQWRGLMLIPWGTLYRVFAPLSLAQVQELHHFSLHRLQLLQAHFPTVDDTFMRKFIPGSWERAAANVYYDAHYQLGVNLLTYCVELQAKTNMQVLPLLLDRYYVSAQLLKITQDAVLKYGTFSSSLTDLSKNTALAWVRLQGLIKIVRQFRVEIEKEVNKLVGLPQIARSQTLLNATAVLSLLEPQTQQTIATVTHEVVSGFLQQYPQDKDAKVFANALASSAN